MLNLKSAFLCMTSFENSFCPIPQFLFGHFLPFLTFILSYILVLYILDTGPVTVDGDVSYSVGCLFVQMILTFTV